MSRRAKKNAARAVLGAVLLAMALFALLPFVYMGLVSLTQKTVLDLRLTRRIYRGDVDKKETQKIRRAKVRFYF